MDLRLLRTFSAVVNHGSFTAAAAALGYTQSAISQHIAALESSLNVALFTRRPFALTPAAERLAEHAANILLRVDVATSELTPLRRQSITVVAATPLAASTPAVARLVAFAQQAESSPAARLVIAESDEIAARVASADYSLGVVDGIVGRADPLAHADPGLLTALVLRTAPLAVAMPIDHPLASRVTVVWASIVDARWVDAPTLLSRPGPGATHLLDRRVSRTSFDGSEPSILTSLVAAGHGLALVPAWWGAAAGVAIVPIEAPALVHRIEVLVLRSRAAAFADAVASARG